MNLSKIDKKLLGYLYHNCNDSYTKISKETNLTRNQVEYNIKKYIKNKIINQFITLFNYNKLGYKQTIVLLIKLKKKSDFENFKKLLSNKNIFEIGEISNKFHIYINLVFKDDLEKNNFLKKTLFNKYVDNYLILEPLEMNLYPLKFLDYNYNKNQTYNIKESKKDNLKLDDLELKIINIIKNNARIKIVEIAKQLKQSSELILYKIKKLKEKNIILGNRIDFNMEKLGFFYSVILINIQNLNDENYKIIERFARKNKFVNSFAIMNSRPNILLQIFHKEELDLRNSIEELNELFFNENIEIDILYLKQQNNKINTFPF